MQTDWTPVALSHDIPVASAAPGRIGDTALAIWRSASGRIAAWSDRCPHRGMRLSHGYVRGERLSCIYHGWSYGEDGGCKRIPAHPDLTPPESIRVPVFACREASGVVWVAEGQPAGAPPDLAGFRGLRSLHIAAATGAIAEVFGGDGPVLRVKLGPVAVIALVQAFGDETMLHLMAPESCDLATLDALSDAAEALRRNIEAEATA
ncbi:hypothetical protein GCM10011415_41480 [Salipiger pallidus]|uniref:Rieske domain-containing protein n=1 Tax=Salipiger pallidus TaxID=1775170 RepID=A0A8J2ZP90_9RHOB|nr:Rieske (2Fe-2S) protein [Salipiger pallidus]GGG86719.1 hypothetical protein GCM10011415_41480 [Salipiger pallidus]